MFTTSSSGTSFRSCRTDVSIKGARFIKPDSEAYVAENVHSVLPPADSVASKGACDFVSALIYYADN